MQGPPGDRSSRKQPEQLQPRFEFAFPGEQDNLVGVAPDILRAQADRLRRASGRYTPRPSGRWARLPAMSSISACGRRPSVLAGSCPQLDRKVGGGAARQLPMPGTLALCRKRRKRLEGLFTVTTRSLNRVQSLRSRRPGKSPAAMLGEAECASGKPGERRRRRQRSEPLVPAKDFGAVSDGEPHAFG